MQLNCFERFGDFCLSLDNLISAKGRDFTDILIVSGVCQIFSITFDISWKLMKDIAIEYCQVEDTQIGSPKKSLRAANSVNLISSDTWLDMLECRNSIAHEYVRDYELWERVDKIMNSYIPLFQDLKTTVSDLITKTQSGGTNG